MDTQKKARHLMVRIVFTLCNTLNHDSPDLEENRSPFARQRTETLKLRLGI